MDPIKILQRAWHILWSYRTLWAFGLVLALAAGGSFGGGGNNGVRYREEGDHTRPAPQNMQEFFRELQRQIDMLFREGIPGSSISGEQLTAFLWTVGAFVVFMLLVGTLITIAYYVSVAAVIHMVDEYEGRGTKMTVREGIRIGWSRTAWRMFLINLIINLPAILFFLALLIAGVMVFLSFVNGNTALSSAGIAGLVGLFLLGITAVVVLSLLLGLLRPFFWRVCALEGAGVGESLRRGFAMVREHWKNVGMMWLVMIGLGLAWIIASILVILITIPVVILTAVLAALVAAIPGMLLVGLFSLFLGGPLPWIAAGLFVLPLFFTIAFSPWILLGSWQSVFTSTVWTLTYRELKALPAVAPQPAPVPVGD